MGHALSYKFEGDKSVLLNPNPTAPQTEEALSWRERLVEFAYTGRRKFATAATGMLVLVVGWHVVFGANGLTAYEAKRKQTIDLATQIDRLKTENAKLSVHNDRLQHDRGSIEESIRANLHYAKPDEVLVTVPPAPQSPAK
jgi:cell division protein FtsB